MDRLPANCRAKDVPFIGLFFWGLIILRDGIPHLKRCFRLPNVSHGEIRPLHVDQTRAV
jgi:hypothetical protein